MVLKQTNSWVFLKTNAWNLGERYRTRCEKWAIFIKVRYAVSKNR